MLRPKDTPTRDTRTLNGLWSFALDRRGEGHPQGWFRGPLPDAVPVPVPASYNELWPDESIRSHVGEVWYQRQARIPAGWAGQRIVLRLDSATHAAVVYVDDVEVVRHVGGYLPFEADITAHVTPGAEHRISIAVDNILTMQSVPPGQVVENAAGTRRQKYFHDFFNYAGLHRTVWLYATPATYVRDITVVTDVQDSTGYVSYSVDVAGTGDVTVSLIDEAGAVVATGGGLEGRLEVPQARLWQPGAAYLYRLEVTVSSGGSVVDVYDVNVGIRTVKVQGNRFLINGEPFYFTGFGKHEDNNVRGKQHDDVMMIHDFALLKWIGANSFRTAHYPYAEEVLDLADREGIVIIDETPAVGMNFGLAGGIFGASPGATYSPDTINDTTREAHAQVIRELVARDKNHPCVVMWSIANEPESGTTGARDYFEPLFTLTRELDPTRPVTFVNVMLDPVDKCQVSEFADVLCLNRYYGWYVSPGDLEEGEVNAMAELTGWATKYDKPIIITEYGADAVAGIHGFTEQPWSEDYQLRMLEMNHRVFDRIDSVIGEHVWAFADFATGPGFFRVDGNKKGVFTRERRPKKAAFMLRERWTEGKK